MSSYIPEAGDLVWLQFNPQAGHEQAGHRPAIVLSQKMYNQKTGLGIFCPITSKPKGFLTEVEVPGIKIQGVVLADQIKNLDWKSRKATFIEKASPEVIEEVKAKLLTIIL